MKDENTGSELKFVPVTNKSYGNPLKGTKVYFEGRKRPKKLRLDGSISFGKNILELLKKKFSRFVWILTVDEDSIRKHRNIWRVRTSLKTLSGMDGERFERTRDIKEDIIAHRFALLFPDHFALQETTVYVQGTIAKLLTGDIVTKLSPTDKDALNKFLPSFIASESVGTVNLLNAEAQIKSLKQLVREFGNALKGKKSENWWQSFVRSNILIMQQGYIKTLEKLNVAIGASKLPDFSLITHDGYLDILEIKKADTELLKHDASRDNYFWSPEIAKAIIQTENYIALVMKQADSIRSHLKDKHDIDMRIVQPRGIILAGNSMEFKNPKEKDDFRLLSLGLKNLTVLTYDELLTRVENYINVLEAFSSKKGKPLSKGKRKRRKAE